jgi:hypothetical protein
MDLELIAKSLSFITLMGCACDKLKRLIEFKYTFSYFQRELNNDISFLSCMPREPYVVLNDNQQEVLEGFNDYLTYLRKKYSLDTSSNLLKSVSEGSDKSELRAKQKRIEKLLSQIPSIRQSDNFYY